MARLRKTVIQQEGSSGKMIARFQEPTALIGFEFNSKQKWESCTNFFPELEINANNVSASIPAISWGREVRPPAFTNLAAIDMHAISTDLNQTSVSAELLSTLSLNIREKDVLIAQEWHFSLPADTKWLLVIAVITFDSNKKQLSKTEKTAGIYLFAKSINN